MNGERKLNDASKIAKTMGPVPGPLKTETSGKVPHVPGPPIHRSWDAMDSNEQKLYKQGKCCFYQLLVLLWNTFLLQNTNNI